eukprot:6184890-Pleurochrysis_carterae.AAC.3
MNYWDIGNFTTFPTSDNSSSKASIRQNFYARTRSAFEKSSLVAQNRLDVWIRFVHHVAAKNFCAPAAASLARYGHLRRAKGQR